MMAKKTFEPPRCPSCGTKLTRVLETAYMTFTFDKETGHYREDGDSKATCPNCKADLYDVFSDGVCNYRGQEFQVLGN